MTNMHVKRWKEHRHEIGYGHLYQGRYKCFPVETEGYFYQVVRYVERNALRADLCRAAEEWRWSSLWRWRHIATEDVPPLAAWPIDRPCHWLRFGQPHPGENRIGGVTHRGATRAALRQRRLAGNDRRETRA